MVVVRDWWGADRGRPPPRSLRALAVVALGGCAALALLAAPALGAKKPWPPIPERGAFFAHYGEEHWNDADGLRILPKVIRQTARYGPDLVTMSADKDDDGTVEDLTKWKELMEVYDREGIPYFAAVGNHDRKAREGFPHGVDPMGDLSNYMDVFADRPYPMGDAPPPADPRFAPQARPAGDPPGASSHYSFDYGPVRWIFIDNSCFGIANCDPLQNPPFPDADGNQGQYDFLAAEADGLGKLVFVVMHMPTQDDRPGHTNPTPFPHTMGEGSSPDNAMFEQAAAAAGVDAVFTGHIKGQWHYTAEGIPYYVDGGAGGEVYVGPGEETGVDSGYWHGYRLVHVRRGRVEATDTVPVFARAGITISGPRTLDRGEVGEFAATGSQPTVDGPLVDSLELREPDPNAQNADKLPTPARIWTTANRRVLAPVEAKDDDPRRDPKRQTVSGRFRARCPGRTRVRVKSGWASESFGVRVVAPGERDDKHRC